MRRWKFSKNNLTVYAAAFFILVSFPFSSSARAADEKEQMAQEIERVKKELKTVTRDRDNILVQAKTFLKEKEDMARQLKEIKNSGSQSSVEVEALKKEIEMLKTQTEKAKTERQQALASVKGEKEALENKVTEFEAKYHSLASTVQEYPPGKIQELIADRNRLEEENKKMASRLIEMDTQMQEMKRQMKPFELDREEINRLRAENKEILKKTKYVSELETRQRELLRENAENREKLEVLKAKFKESVPGLAKASRISQKMMRENADMHYNLATIFLKNKQYKEAIGEYEQVLELRPSDPETHYNLGVLYDDYVRDREKALYHYQRYLSVNPKAPDAKKVETYILSLELEQKVR